MKDLVGVGVPDATEEARVGEGALEGVVLALQLVGECMRRGVEYFEATAVDRGKRVFSLHEGERCSPFGSGFGEYQNTVRKIEAGKSEFEWNLAIGRPPAKAASDHEVDDEEELIAEVYDQSLSQTAHPFYRAANDCRDRRIDRSKKKGVREAEAFQGMADDVPVERFEVDGDVGEFGHAAAGSNAKSSRRTTEQPLLPDATFK